MLRWLALGGGVAIAVVVALMLLSGSGGSGSRPPPPRATPRIASAQVGISVNRLFNDGTWSAAAIGSQLAALRATGDTLARSDALWEASEPQPPVGGRHRYDWAFDDTVAGDLAAHGIRWLPILDYTARWAESVPGLEHSPPRAPEQFAAYAGAFAARYGPGGAFWRLHPRLAPLPVGTYEVWNEPDTPSFWPPQPDPAAYADLYLRARQAILAADPSARVIVGGLAHPEAFLPAMLQARPELRGRIDGVGIHPYGPSPLVVLARVRTARAVLDRLGLSTVPLYVTEFGWPTLPPGTLNWAPAATRPTYITATLAALGHTNCGVAAAILYTWVTPERNPSDREDWFGIHPPAGGKSPSTVAFAAGLREARAAAPTATLCS